MSDFLAAEGIPRLAAATRAEHITADLDLVVVGNAISRGNPELEEVLDRKIRYCSLPEAIREHFLWGARSIVIAGTHGKTTTTSLTGWVLTHGGVDPSVLVGGIARNFGEQRIELPHRAGARLRHRRRRVRQRVLRQDREVPEVPAGHRRRQQRRVRPRRHLRRPRRGDARVPAAREPGAAPRPAAARRRQPGARGADDAAPCRASRRSALGDGVDWQAHDLEPAGASTRFKVRRARSAVRRRSRCRCSARTTCATRWPRSRSRPKSASAPERIARRPAGVRRRQAAARGRRRRPTASRSTTISRIIRRRWPKRWPACARRIPDARIWAVFEPRSASSCRRIFQDDFARAFAGADEVVDRAGLPVDAAGGRAAVGAAAGSRSETTAGCRPAKPTRSTTSSPTSSREHRPGDLVVLMSNGGFGGIHQKLLRALASWRRDR